MASTSTHRPTFSSRQKAWQSFLRGGGNCSHAFSLRTFYEQKNSCDTESREYTFTWAATGRLMRNQKNLLKALATSQSTFRVLFPLNKPKWKSACKSSENWAAVSLVYRYILNYSERFQIPLIIQRHLQGTDLFERKRLPKKKYRHLRKVWILSFLLLCRQAVFALITVKFSRAVVCHDQLFKIIFLCPLIAVAIFILSTKSQTGILCKWENLFSTVHYKRFRVHGSYLS